MKNKRESEKKQLMKANFSKIKTIFPKFLQMIEFFAEKLNLYEAFSKIKSIKLAKIKNI